MTAYNPKFFDTVFQSWDMSFKEDGQSRVCGLIIGHRRGGMPIKVNPYGDIYILDYVADYMAFTTAQAEVLRMSKTHPAAYHKVVEQAANGDAIISSLSSVVGGFIPWPPRGVKKRGKTESWHAASPPQRGGNCHLPVDAPWRQEFIDNMGHLPHGTPNDEGDAFSQAVDYITTMKRRPSRGLLKL